MSDTMRAARLMEPGRMECEQAEVRPPGEGEVVVKTELAAICGSDLHLVFFGMADPDTLPAAPGWPGHEGVGEVVESRHPKFKRGDRVLTCPHTDFVRGFADYQTLPGDSCLLLPDYDGPVEDLLMAQQFGTTIFALRRGNFDFTGKTVMVMGQGSAGVFFAWQARQLGAAKVIVSDLSEARLDYAKQAGSDVAVQADPAGENVKAAVMDHTGGQGADILIEAVGRRETLLQSIDLLRPDGNAVFFGLPDSKEPVPFNFHDFFRKRIQAYTIYGTQHEADLVSFQRALDWIARGEIDVSRLVSHRVAIEQIQEGMVLANERADGARKVAVTF